MKIKCNNNSELTGIFECDGDCIYCEYAIVN